jgi:APA family basic amino acid/polyamine antiporter
MGFSSLGVLHYYRVPTVSAYTPPRSQRRFPRALQVVGAVGCLVLVATLPVASIVTGVAVALAGVVYRALTVR